MTCSHKEDAPTPTRLFWLAFFDAAQPEEEHFLGVCVVEVKRFPVLHDSIKAAVRKVDILGIDPGGGVQVIELTDHSRVHPTWRDTFLSLAISLAAGEASLAAPRPVDIFQLNCS